MKKETSDINETARQKLMNGEFNQALKLFTRVIEEEPFYIKAYINRSFCYSKTGEKEKALKDLNKAVSVDSDSSLAYYYRGAYYFNNKDTDSAIKDFSKVIELNNNEKYTIMAYTERAKSYFRKDMFENVFLDIDSALIIDKNNALLFNMKGSLKGILGLHEDALTAFSKASELEPENENHIIEKIKANYHLENYLDVINDYTKLKESEEKNPEKKKVTVLLKNEYTSACYFVAKKYSKNEDYKEAERYYNNVLEVDHDLVLALYERATLKIISNRNMEALTDFYKIIEVDPENSGLVSDIYRRIATTYKILKDYDNAAIFFTKLINISPEISENYRLRASVYTDSGQYDKAAEDYNKAVESDPDQVINYFERGRFNFFKNKDFEKVISDYLKIPEDFYFLFEVKRLLGYSYFFVNKFDDALKNFDDALKIKPDSNEIKEQTEKISFMIMSEKIKNLREITELMVFGNEQATSLDEIPGGYGEFGLSATNPVPVKGMSGNISYLSKLITIEGDKIEYKRLGSTEANNIEMPVDIYEISVNGKSLTKIYISPYHKRISEKAPKGFMFIGDDLANIKNISLN